VSRVAWRWSERDFGFRFRTSFGSTRGEYYQGKEPGTFYSVPAKHRKFSKKRLEELEYVQNPVSPQIVPTPWLDYDLDWERVTTSDGILLNYAGCLELQEIHRREDEGVARAMEFVVNMLDQGEPVELSTDLIRQIHIELMGAIYPFAGAWRTVQLHKGDGPTKWPLPPAGIEPFMDAFEREVLAQSPFISAVNAEVFDYVGQVMGEFLAIHPFREGNGRTAFILGNLLLMQNDLLPLDVYDRLVDEARYFSACEDARIHKNYTSLAALVSSWQEAAQVRWESVRGQ